MRTVARARRSDFGSLRAPGQPAGHLVSWAKVCLRAIQSGAKTRPGKTGHGDTYLKAALGEAAASAAQTNTFLGARYRRLVKHLGKPEAQVAIARSILVIVWHLLAEPTLRYTDPGPEFYDHHLQAQRRTPNHVRQLEALGHKVTLEPVAA